MNNQVLGIVLKNASVQTLNALVITLQGLITQVGENRATELAKYTAGTDQYTQRTNQLGLSITTVQEEINSRT